MFLFPHPSIRTLIKLVDFHESNLNDNDIVCYADGRKLNEKVGLTFISFSTTLNCFIKNFELVVNVPFFRQNFYVKILLDKHVLHYREAKILMCGDSQCSHHILCVIRSFEKLVVEVHNIISTLDINLDFIQTSICENKKPNVLVKGATLLPFTLNISKPYAYWKIIYFKEIVKG